MKDNQKKIVVNFEDCSVSDFVNLSDDIRFTKVRIKAFADKENTNTAPVDLVDLKFSANTIYNIPIKVQFTSINPDGLGTHSPECINIGFIPKEDNALCFEYDEKRDKTFVVVNGLIWNGDSKNIIEIMKKTDGVKKVSVELLISEYETIGGVIKPKKFIFTAVCILSDFISEACKGSNIKLSFEEDKKAYLNQIEFAENSININNDSKSCVKGAWTDPRQKLLNPIIKASNKDELLKEAYLQHDNSEKISLSHVHYPHHVIKDGKLVLHLKGLQSAFSRASVQNILGDVEVRRHLIRHYKELGLSTENFAEVGLTIEQYNYFCEMEKEVITLDREQKIALIKAALSVYKFTKDDTKCKLYTFVSFEDDIVRVKNNKDGNEYTISCVFEDDKCVCGETFTKVECGEPPVEPMAEPVELTEPVEPAEPVAELTNPVDPAEPVNNSDPEPPVESKCDNCDKLTAEYAELNIRFEALTAKYAELENANAEYMAKLDKMGDYAELKKFKEDTVAQQMAEEQNRNIEAVFASITERGVKMSDTDKSALRDKISEFSNITAWGNYVKAYVFDSFNTVPTIVGINNNSIPKGSNSLWDNVKY